MILTALEDAVFGEAFDCGPLDVHNPPPSMASWVANRMVIEQVRPSPCHVPAAATGCHRCMHDTTEAYALMSGSTMAACAVASGETRRDWLSC